ncbi:MAG: hypothetical protein CMQ41_12075 [Gammaproteobacteria bacterium]|nr:hypothetical protein [Gammaproteobacteria bacterium]
MVTQLFRLVVLFLILDWVLSAPIVEAQTGIETSSGQLLDRALSQYCVVCHNDTLLTANFTLQGISSVALSEHSSALEKVLRRLKTGEMPPPGMPRPDESERIEIVNWLESELDKNARMTPDPGSPAIHRLNRVEYNNAVRDLLGIDLDHAEDLPADDSGYGFDNISGVLTVSPLHIEKYVAAARQVSRLAVGTLEPRPVVHRYSPQVGAVNEAIPNLPLNVRGAISFKHIFPFSADYTITVRVGGRRMSHMPAPLLDVRVDGKRVELIEASFSNAEAEQGSRLFEVPVTLEAGSHEIAAGFLGEYSTPETSIQGNFDNYNSYAVDYVLIGGPYAVTKIGMEESHKRIFICRPETVAQEESCARRILSALARRAYRGPVFENDIDPIMELFTEGREDGGSFEHGIEMALSGLLVSPRFLFRSPPVPVEGKPSENYRLSDLDLASRLSFFLWSSIPDQELLSLAEQGALSEPRVLSGQLKRMLVDPKSKALIENFGGQWLHLRNIADWAPDPDRYAHFNDSLRYAFQQETELFLENLVYEDRSVLDLINANYTFVNQRLAEFYGIDGVEGDYFRQVSLAGTGRRGVLGQGSILMVTSYPTRTSPVLRGKWVLENLLGSPPPPPPPDIPALDDSAEISASSLREALEQHRANPACAVCHNRLDPLGFALESFDAVGRRRINEDGTAIDDSGALPDGTLVDGLDGLRVVLLARRDEFIETLAEKLLTYAIGRGLEDSDRPALREIRRHVESSDFRFSSLVDSIVDSVPFRMRRIPEV